MKLTTEMLKKIIKEEAAKFGDMSDPKDVADDTEETDADELADSLEKHIDYVKALKIEEVRLTSRLAKIREAKERAVKKMIKKI